MNHLIAQLKGTKIEIKTFKVFSDEIVYDLPTDLNNPKSYNSDYKLEDDEWFHIPNFSDTEYCIPLLKRTFNSTEYNQINTEQLKKIDYLLSYQRHNNNEYYFFQNINTSHLIKKRWFKSSNTPTLEKNIPIIIINDIADAIYSKENDILYFKKLTSISSIFKGISELYREATQTETEDFLNKDFITLDDGYEANKVGAANRKRIAMAMSSFSNFTTSEKSKIHTYIKDYCTNIPFNKNSTSFTIKNEDDLKHLLWGIEQRYYTTPIGKEKRIANSISKVDI